MVRGSVFLRPNAHYAEPPRADVRCIIRLAEWRGHLGNSSTGPNPPSACRRPGTELGGELRNLIRDGVGVRARPRAPDTAPAPVYTRGLIPRSSCLLNRL